MGLRGKPLRRAPYMTKAMPSHPTAHADGRVRVHRAVLYDAIGPGVHKCNWCNSDLEWFADRPRELIADHLDTNTWNNSPGNLVPSCFRCNGARRLREMTHCSRGHEFTPENTYLRPDRHGRQCRTCNQARGVTREANRRARKALVQ